MLKRADKLRARAAVIIGSNEIASGKLTVKDLANGTQSEVSVADLRQRSASCSISCWRATRTA